MFADNEIIDENMSFLPSQGYIKALGRLVKY